KKDLRNAVVAARKAFGPWSAKSAFNRSQILYRIAEMLEGRKDQLIAELMQLGVKKPAASKEVEEAIDRCIYYAGWCDKYQALVSSVNPVASSHFNFTIAEPTGVVGIVAEEKSGLLGLISLILPVIAGGNTLVALASESMATCAVTFAEIVSTSDVAGGVINILTGQFDELKDTFATHMDINALALDRKEADCIDILEKASVNVKRIRNYQHDWTKSKAQGLDFITDFQEYKTTWHPIEKIGAAGSGY
ncbi:MAG: aldehyde dehydrogenase family protein, partial [Bacteroidetes bacterium]|nr:aldehyde dehydrogenase family protein [Bacteroidota bacterium]